MLVRRGRVALPLVLVSSLGSDVSAGYLTGDFQGLGEISAADLCQAMGAHPRGNVRLPRLIKGITQVFKKSPAFV